MANTWRRGKEIEVNKSSLVELKAEVFRKKAEYEREKAAGPAERAAARQRVKKPSAVKQNKGVAERAQRDVQQLAEEARDAERSRAKLEQKAKLYDELKKRAGELDFDDEERILVDFEKKAWEVCSSGSDSEEEALLRQYHSPPKYEAASADDEWVEYTDDLGRTRKCLRKDLPYMQAREQRMPKRSPSPVRYYSDEGENDEMFPLPKKLRTEEPQRPAGPVYFQEVFGNEIRDLGVGYYGFSQDPEERQRQMDELKKLREQTVELRDRRRKLRQRKAEALERRLAKVRERKEKREQSRMQLDAGGEPESGVMSLPPGESSASEEEEEGEEEGEEEEVLGSRVADFFKNLTAELQTRGLGTPTEELAET